MKTTGITIVGENDGTLQEPKGKSEASRQPRVYAEADVPDQKTLDRQEYFAAQVKDRGEVAQMIHLALNASVKPLAQTVEVMAQKLEILSELLINFGIVASYFQEKLGLSDAEVNSVIAAKREEIREANEREEALRKAEAEKGQVPN